MEHGADAFLSSELRGAVLGREIMAIAWMRQWPHRFVTHL